MSTDARSDFDPFATIAQLREDGRALPVAWTPDVFRKLVTDKRGRVIGAKHGAEPADFHADEGEMHPGGDELLYLYLLPGARDVILDEPGSERRFGLRVGRARVVPSGVWHRLILRQPSDLPFITPAHGTWHRPVGTARPAHPDG